MTARSVRSAAGLDQTGHQAGRSRLFPRQGRWEAAHPKVVRKVQIGHLPSLRSADRDQKTASTAGTSVPGPLERAGLKLIPS